MAGQSLGALNDNAYRMIIILAVLDRVSDVGTQLHYSALGTSILPIAFLIVSPYAGILADRYRKSDVLFWTKLPEIVAMLAGVFALASGSLPWAFFIFFLMASHSAFFSPAKYSFLPEIVSKDALVHTNGILNALTNISILGGNIVGVLVYKAFKSELYKAGLVCVGIAVVGTLLIRLIPKTTRQNPDHHVRSIRDLFFADRLLRDWRWLRETRPDLLAMIAWIAFFNGIGSLFITMLPLHGKNTLGLSTEDSGLLLALLTVSIGAGSLICGQLNKNKLTIRHFPYGLAGMAAATLLMGFAHDLTVTMIALSILGVGAGFFVTPIQGWIQHHLPDDSRGRGMSFQNTWAFIAILVSSSLPWIAHEKLNLSLSTVFFLCFAIVLGVSWRLRHTFRLGRP